MRRLVLSGHAYLGREATWSCSTECLRPSKRWKMMELGSWTYVQYCSMVFIMKDPHSISINVHQAKATCKSALFKCWSPWKNQSQMSQAAPVCIQPIHCRSFCKGNQGRHQHSTCCSCWWWSHMVTIIDYWHHLAPVSDAAWWWMMVTTMMTMRMRNTNINWYLFQCMRVTVDEDDCWLRDPRGLACFSSTEYCRDICDNEMKLYEMTTMSIDRKIRKYANACIETMVRFQPAWQTQTVADVEAFQQLHDENCKSVKQVSIIFSMWLDDSKPWMVLKKSVVL